MDFSSFYQKFFYDFSGGQKFNFQRKSEIKIWLRSLQKSIASQINVDILSMWVDRNTKRMGPFRFLKINEKRQGLLTGKGIKIFVKYKFESKLNTF